VVSSNHLYNFAAYINYDNYMKTSQVNYMLLIRGHHNNNNNNNNEDANLVEVYLRIFFFFFFLIEFTRLHHSIIRQACSFAIKKSTYGKN
jgi:hypothetical protein